MVVWSVSGILSKQEKVIVRSKKIDRTNAAAAKKAESSAKINVQLPTPEAAAEKTASLDVFNQIRSPFANTRMSSSSLTLLGTFKAGKLEGAIIRQQSRNRQFNPYLMQAMRMAGTGAAGGRRMGRFGGGMGRQFNAVNQPLKHYIRVGETLSNGYTLIEVSRTKAVLVRGNDKLELELQDPSKNRTAITRRAAPRMNANQQFQQAQMFMQGQMMRTMQQMQQQMNRGGGRSGGRR
jgi:hypothetical protein